MTVNHFCATTVSDQRERWRNLRDVLPATVIACRRTIGIKIKALSCCGLRLICWQAFVVCSFGGHGLPAREVLPVDDLYDLIARY
jgi:hypothetical protein